MKYTVPAIASLILAAQLLSAIPKLSPTTDEFTFHVPTGLVYWKTGDFTALNPAAPPLARLISTVPAHLLNIRVPLEHPSFAAFDAETFSRELYYNSGNDHYFLTLITRFPIALLSMILLWIIWGWSTSLYGTAGGLLSAFLYLFCPNILAHSTVATQDLAMTLAWMAAIWGLWNYHQGRGRVRLALAGCLLGLALLTKHTAILLFPISLFFISLSTWSELTPKKLVPIIMTAGSRWLLYLIVAFAVIWVGYGFEFKPILAGLPRIDEKIAFIRKSVNLVLGQTLWDSPISEAIQSYLVQFAQTVRLPLTSYWVSLAGVIKHSTEGHLTYLMGEFSQMGWPHYFLVAFLIKTPIPFLFLLLVTLGFTLIKRSGRSMADLFLILPALVLFVSASIGHLQIGLRHILPLYPLLFVWCGKVGTLIHRILGRSDTETRLAAVGGGLLRRESALLVQRIRKRKFKSSLVASIALSCGLWYSLSTLRIAPHYLGYFNELIGGPKNGYRYLLDSNIEWGQGLIELGQFVKKNDLKKIYIDYPWTPLPEKYGISAENAPLTSAPPQGWYAISVNHLHQYPWTKNRRPIAQIGYGILIYKF
ncbi:MAG: glycosyltransferase family 39 protein [Deltaproteobacteria bacterium]|nr:glycosyltransferase family 39 protein [Deltaproteobacteria bacterium]